MSDQKTLSAELGDAHSRAFKIVAMLQGTSALLEGVEHLPDEGGSIWAARELVDAAWVETQNMIGDFADRDLVRRVEQIETCGQ